jgi:hypothetical protein
MHVITSNLSLIISEIHWNIDIYLQCNSYLQIPLDTGLTKPETMLSSSYQTEIKKLKDSNVGWIVKW